MQDKNVDPLINVNKAAEYLALSKWQLYKLASQKQIQSYKLGNRVRFRLGDLNRYLESCMRGSIQ